MFHATQTSSTDGSISNFWHLDGKNCYFQISKSMLKCSAISSLRCQTVWCSFRTDERQSLHIVICMMLVKRKFKYMLFVRYTTFSFISVSSITLIFNTFSELTV